MYSGPHIKRDGLVFGYDTGRNPSSNFDHKNKKRRFFKGRAVTNVVTNTNLNTGWSKGYQTAIEYDEIKPPKGVKSQVVGFNKSSSSSYWYSYGDYAPQTPNTTYTVSIYVKTRDSNFRIRFYTANNSETGRVWGSYITVPNDNKWHRIVWPSFLNPSNSQSDSLSFNMSMASSGDSSRTWFCAPQMEVGTKASPFVEGSRSSTESLIDLTKTTNIDVSNVSFDSTGQPTFDGSNDYIALTNNPQWYTNDWSWEIVVKFGTNSGTYQGIVWAEGATGGGSGYSYLLTMYNQSYFHYRIYNASTGWTNTNFTPSGFSATNYNHIVWQFNNGTTRIYINGNLVHTNTSRGVYNGSTNSPLYVGSRNDLAYDFTGQIPVLKFYNKTLSADEVQQNFRAYKNRFNI